MFIRCVLLTIFYVHRSAIYEIFIQIYLNIMCIDRENKYVLAPYGTISPVCIGNDFRNSPRLTFFNFSAAMIRSTFGDSSLVFIDCILSFPSPFVEQTFKLTTMILYV